MFRSEAVVQFNCTTLPAAWAPKAISSTGVGMGCMICTSSTAKEGSVPAPSLLFTQWKAILKVAMFSHEAGSGMLMCVHRPCPPQPALLVLGMSSSVVQVLPLLVLYSE
ncbi:MAG: hypothetical protein IPL81_04475 [Flavobacteriales bacterium]|nr:hypothetical protein [Flavobacteriales bacterium]